MSNENSQGVVPDRYLSNRYLESNPSWGREDSLWKARHVLAMLNKHRITPKSLADVGCGAGLVLAELKAALSQTNMAGFDIAPDAKAFWQIPLSLGIDLKVGDFFEMADQHYDLIMVLDVLEHLSKPHEFLQTLKKHGDNFIFHIPLDLSVKNILREDSLVVMRQTVGHIHYFTRRLALALLIECGYKIVDWKYTGAAFTTPQRTWRTRLAFIFRGLIYALSKDFGVRLLGGETLIVLAQPDFHK